MNLSIYAWGGLITTFTNLAFASFVYFKNRRGLVNKIFPLFSLSIGLWSFGWFKAITSSTPIAALHWAKILSVGSIFISAFFLHFIFAILNIIKEKKRILIANYILAFIFLSFCFFTNLFIKDMAPIFSFNYHIQPGPIYIFHFLSFIIIIIYGAFELFKASKISVGLKRNQLRYLFWALVVGYTGGTTAYFPIYKIPMPSWGVYTIPITIIMMAYAIIKYRLMDIKVAITRTGIFVAIYTLVLGVPFTLAVVGRHWLIKILGQNWWLGPLTLLTILATIGPFLYIYLQRRAESILLRKQRAYQDTLKQAARELARIHKSKKLLNLIVHIVTKTAGIRHSAIYLFDKESQHYLLKATRNFKNELVNSIHKENPIILWFNKQKEPLVCEEINRTAEDTFDPVFKELERSVRSLNATVIIPGFLKDRLLGFLILGDKRWGGFYTTQDLDTFVVLANQAALAIENALLYENIEEQVRQRTKELMEVQKQLIQAEKLATMGTLAGGVAHEINNPLTAILTNVQMLLDAEGTLDADTKESMEIIEEATKRCKTIVQKLMAYAKKPLETADVFRVNLLEVIKDVMALIGYQLEQEDIKVIVEAKDGAYFVRGNRNELEQAATNIILNARDAIKQIKRSGKIQISLLPNGDWIDMVIQDEGIGMTEQTISKIFDPFFTTKDVGKGTGLGLSICQSIIEKHNGKILVQSEPNQGSVFTVRLLQAKVEEMIKK